MNKTDVDNMLLSYPILNQSQSCKKHEVKINKRCYTQRGIYEMNKRTLIPKRKQHLINTEVDNHIPEHEPLRRTTPYTEKELKQSEGYLRHDPLWGHYSASSNFPRYFLGDLVKTSGNHSIIGKIIERYHKNGTYKYMVQDNDNEERIFEANEPDLIPQIPYYEEGEKNVRFNIRKAKVLSVSDGPPFTYTLEVNEKDVDLPHQQGFNKLNESGNPNHYRSVGYPPSSY